MRVREAMTTPVITLSPETSVREVLVLWKKHPVEGFPVVFDDVPIGIVTESDLVTRDAPIPTPAYVHVFDLMIQLESSKSLLKDILKVAGAKVKDVMTQPVVTIRDDLLVEDAAQVMVQAQVNLLPVVDASGKLVGILSRGDILKTMGSSEGA